MPTKDFQTAPLLVSIVELGVRPRYFSIASAGLLALLVYANTSISFRELGLQIQLIAVIPLVVLWFGLVGIRLQSAIFANVALIPATLLWGAGYLKLPGMALTLSDIFTIISIGLFLIKPQPLYRNKYTTGIWLMLALCVVSVLLAENPGGHLGQLLRLGLSVGLTSIIVSSRHDTLKKPVQYGMLLWPVIALSNVAGIESLWRFISFSDGKVFNVVKTGEVLLGSHQVVAYLTFFLPLLLLIKSSRAFILVLLSWLGVLVVFSYSRSLAIGIGTAVLLYLLFMNTGKQKIAKFALAGALGVGLVFGVIKLGFFNFTPNEGSKSLSSHIRITKMLAAWNTFTEHPALGIGYGAVGAIDTKRTASAISAEDPHYLDVLTDVKASAEFTPSQILAETGLAGGLISLFLMILSFKRTIQVLKNPEKPVFLKITLLCAAVVFVANFVGGNAFSILVFWLAVPLILGETKWRVEPNVGYVPREHAIDRNRSYE